MFWNNIAVFHWSRFSWKGISHQLHTMWWKMRSSKARSGSRSPSNPRYKMISCVVLDSGFKMLSRISRWSTMCFFFGWYWLGKPKQGCWRGDLWRLEKLWCIILRERNHSCVFNVWFESWNKMLSFHLKVFFLLIITLVLKFGFLIQNLFPYGDFPFLESTKFVVECVVGFEGVLLDFLFYLRFYVRFVLLGKDDFTLSSSTRIYIPKHS